MLRSAVDSQPVSQSVLRIPIDQTVPRMNCATQPRWLASVDAMDLVLNSLRPHQPRLKLALTYLRYLRHRHTHTHTHVDEQTRIQIHGKLPEYSYVPRFIILATDFFRRGIIMDFLFERSEIYQSV